MAGASTNLLMMTVLLSVMQSLPAEAVPAVQPSPPQLASPEPGSGSDVEDGGSQAVSAVEVSPITVPVSDAIQEAALLMRPSGATLDQVVSAMVRLNPELFEHGDLRHVTFSRPLAVPSVEQILGEDPAGLELLLLQLDIVRAAMPQTRFSGGSASLQVVKESQDETAVPGETMQLSKQESRAALRVSPAGGSVEASAIFSRSAMFGVGVLLLLLMWMLFRLGRNRSAPPLSTSSSVKSLCKEPLLAVRASPGAADTNQRRFYELPDLPVDYLNYDDIEMLLQRVVAESPDATRQVLQLMRIYQLRQDRENFLRQHRQLLANGFYQRHAEARGIINRSAHKLGLKLDETKGSGASENRIQQLEARVESAEKAKKEAEQRASKAERVASDAKQKLKEMQLKLDFGETGNQ